MCYLSEKSRLFSLTYFTIQCSTTPNTNDYIKEIEKQTTLCYILLGVWYFSLCLLVFITNILVSEERHILTFGIPYFRISVSAFSHHLFIWVRMHGLFLAMWSLHTHTHTHTRGYTHMNTYNQVYVPMIMINKCKRNKLLCYADSYLLIDHF